MSFDHFGLSAEIVRAVTEKGYTQPSPVQEQAIPAILEGRDLIDRALPSLLTSEHEQITSALTPRQLEGASALLRKLVVARQR